MIRVPSWLAQGIPFYLISAACMLGGCLAINNSLSWETTPAVREIILIAQLNVYEVALIALAWFLVRRGQVRDGVMLAGIEAFFLVDVSFLNAQMATGSFGLGLAVNVVLFTAALAKGRGLGADRGTVIVGWEIGGNNAPTAGSVCHSCDLSKTGRRGSGVNGFLRRVVGGRVVDTVKLCDLALSRSNGRAAGLEWHCTAAVRAAVGVDSFASGDVALGLPVDFLRGGGSAGVARIGVRVVSR